MCASVVENRTLKIPVFCTAYLVQTPTIHTHTHSFTHSVTYTNTHTHTHKMEPIKMLALRPQKGRLADGQLRDANTIDQASTTCLQSTSIGIKVFFVFFFSFLKALGRIFNA